MVFWVHFSTVSLNHDCFSCSLFSYQHHSLALLGDNFQQVISPHIVNIRNQNRGVFWYWIWWVDIFWHLYQNILKVKSVCFNYDIYDEQPITLLKCQQRFFCCAWYHIWPLKYMFQKMIEIFTTWKNQRYTAKVLENYIKKYHHQRQ